MTTGTHADGAADSEDGSAVPPGPDGYPLVGNTLRIVREPFDFLDELGSYGDVVRYEIAGNTMTAILHPEYVEQVLVEESDRFERYLFADRGFDFAPEGILFTHGEQWHDQRQVVQPAFTMDRIRSYAETMRTSAEETAAMWADGDEIAVQREFSALTLRILSKALFDVEADPEADDEAIVRAARLINDQASTRSVASFVPEWVPTPGNRRYRRTMAEYHDRIDELIDSRRAGGEDADDLLSLLLRAERPDGSALSEAEIRDNLITFTFAGHETTSLALTYTFLLLAQHDDVLARLQDEHESVLDGSTPGFEHVPQLEYTEQVISEAMRLYPPAYMLFRKATEAVTVGGYELPPGTAFTIPQYSIHRDERWWDEPERFRPERFADDAPDRPEYAYVPFGGGPRHCIGMRFAMLELKLVVAALVRRFEFELLTDSEPELASGATLQPGEEVRLRVRRRD